MRNPLMPWPAAGSRRLSRRSLAGATAGSLAGLALGRSLVAAQGATPAASPVTGEWTFTDDAGKTVTLPKPPARIVADLNIASALADFGIQPIAVSGYTVTTDAAWGRLDRDTPVINANAETGNPDLEELLRLKPDLFMTVVWAPDDPEENYIWSFTEPGLLEQAEQIMPVIGIAGTGSADVNMARLAEFVASTGTDMDTPELTAAKADWEAAKAEFQQLTAEKSDLVSMFAYIAADEAYIANPPRWADLTMFKNFGLTMVEPEVAATEYWQQISAEQANLYPADLLFQSARDGVLSLEELAAQPTYGAMPAVASGQTAAWNQDFILSYQGLAAALRDVIGLLSTAEKVTD